MSDTETCFGCKKSFKITTLLKYDGSNCKNCYDKRLSRLQELAKKKTSETKHKPIPKSIREQVWRKVYGSEGSGLCSICAINTITPFNFECGHDTPKCEGGEDTIDNLFPICNICNKKMGKKTIAEYLKMFYPTKQTTSNIEDMISIVIDKSLISSINKVIMGNKEMYDLILDNNKKGHKTNISIIIKSIENLSII